MESRMFIEKLRGPHAIEDSASIDPPGCNCRVQSGTHRPGVLRRFAKKVKMARKALWFSTGSCRQSAVGQANENFIISFVTASERRHIRLCHCLSGLHLQDVGARAEL
ncbi:unnamed protein product [Toxocara canis]|uniref:Uncharacterized protein n=1 Tax=Toxocara canis TaxID=6265 RepID=A0A183U2G2_TOXCA|nr:unnamed protein product [Toxocara canis]